MKACEVTQLMKPKNRLKELKAGTEKGMYNNKQLQKLNDANN